MIINFKLILLLGDFMKKEKQLIKCNVYDCKHCNCNDECCSLNEIKVCNCDNCKEKESTMCDSYDKRD